MRAAWCPSSAIPMEIPSREAGAGGDRAWHLINLHESDMTVTDDNHLLTLITCDRTYGGADGRFVVMAIRED